MTAETIRILIAAGLFMLLLFLRLESERFGAAEYDEPGRTGSVWTRLSWYLTGAILVAAVYFVHPSPHDVLFLLIGHRPDVVVYGLGLAALGVIQAAAFARFRYGYLRLPPVRAYPNGALNAVGTAFIDEAAFRGVLLGSLVAIGLPDGLAVVMATIVYLLATRLAAPGRHPYMPLLATGIGLACGFATLATGGLGAAFIGHAATSFAVFVCTGHTGQVQPEGNEPEEVALRRQIPEGWQDARLSVASGAGASDFDVIGPSGYGERSTTRRVRWERRRAPGPARSAPGGPSRPGGWTQPGGPRRPAGPGTDRLPR